MDIDTMSENILKTAKFRSAAGRFGAGTLLGAGIGGMKASEANDTLPQDDIDGRDKNFLGKTLSGAAIGGSVAGPGVGLVKKIGKNTVNLFKKSEMEVPNDEERGVTKKEDEDEVLESPNKEERDRMRNSISVDDEKKQYYKSHIEKKAGVEYGYRVAQDLGKRMDDWRWF